MLIFGEISIPLLYRQNYLAADHVDFRRDFRSLIIQTDRRESGSPSISANVNFAYECDFHILRTWGRFCRSVY